MSATITKRIPALLLALVLLLLLPAPAAAAEPDRDLSEAQAAAERLAVLGIFQGSDDGFALERAPTRIEALIMMLRLLGEAGEAAASTEPCPFTDVPDWAKCYVGYAYAKGYTAGSERDPAKNIYLFGTGEAGAATYLTFVLRALGYGDGDFRWDDPYTLSRKLGLLPKGVDTGRFLRADLALVSLAALAAPIKDGGQTLGQRLGVEVIYPPVLASVTAADAGELYGKLASALEGAPQRVELRLSGKLSELTAAELLDLCLDCGCTWFSKASALTSGAAMPTLLEPAYSDAALAWAYWAGLRSDVDNAAYQTAQPLIERAEEILAELALEDASPYETVLAIHDHLAANASYDKDYSSENRYAAAGVLLDGTGVCDSYSYAFWLLCRMAGLDCVRVAGTTGGENHSWNRVALDGVWYNIDVAWDDAIYYRDGVRTEMIYYDYFLVSDETLRLDHSWTAYAGMPAAEADWSE